MGPYHFLLGSGRLSPRRTVERIAQEHKAMYIEYREPGGELRHWFNAENLGAPFDGDRAAAVRAALIAAGVMGVE